MAERVVSDYRMVCKVLGQTPQSKFSRKLKSRHWTVNFAPLPEDIYWYIHRIDTLNTEVLILVIFSFFRENLATGLKTWYLKVFLVNIILAIIVTFYTTPVFLLQAIIPILNINNNNTNTSNFSAEGSDIPLSPSPTSTLVTSQFIVIDIRLIKLNY